jgi:type IV pilus assembly protein PilE
MKSGNWLQKGFTLIELLVVIAIIGILMAAGTVAFTNAQRSSRNSRRQSDMRAIQNAFEQYYTGNSSLYAATPGDMAVGYFPGNELPLDPQGTSYAVNMTGVTGVTATGYCACATLETGGRGNSSDANCSFTNSGSPLYFCVTQRQ